MQNWKITIKETLVRVVEVEADDAMDAEDMVRCSYNNSEIILDADDFNDVTITAEEDKTHRNPVEVCTEDSRGANGGDEYKVKQLQRMLAHETSESELHYGAHLNHWYGDTAHLTIDAGGLQALIRYYQEHETDLGNKED